MTSVLWPCLQIQADDSRITPCLLNFASKEVLVLDLSSSIVCCLHLCAEEQSLKSELRTGVWMLQLSNESATPTKLSLSRLKAN